MADLHFTIDIQAPLEAVFGLIADLANYKRWLPPSKTYAETLDISESPVQTGTTYRDKNTSNVLLGEVQACMPFSLIVFHQSTENPGLDITIRYELAALENGTRLARTTTIQTFGFLRLLQPIVVGQIRQENQRTIQALKTFLETQSIVRTGNKSGL